MTRILGASRVPAGFTITTEACVAYLAGRGGARRVCEAQVDAALARLEGMAGKRLGDPQDPLLVSVRSGARDSMPGMMDTVLNLGLNDASVEGLARVTGNERFAWDSYRRFVQMFGNVVRGVPGEDLEAEIQAVKDARGVKLDTELDVDALRELTRRFAVLYREKTGRSSRRTRASSSHSRSARSSTRGWAAGRSHTGGSTASPTSGGRRSTSSRWSSATRARTPVRASPSPATR